MVSSKTLNSHIKTIRSIVVKGFAKVDDRFNEFDERFNRVDERFDLLDKKIDDTKLELNRNIDDLAGMAAREFKAIRSEICHRNLLQDA